MIRLEGSKFTSQEVMHQQLKSALGLPEHYGANLDALWDSLTAGVELPVKLIWNDFSKSEEYLGYYAKATLQLFEEAEAELGGQFQIKVIRS
ncbi:barstar family protein [Bacillus sp. NPDC077027]|uniref:barstar family protein n=1 Tax=Bacillus sp. NPDC077027 TaxID=3390548 RepID=UPI003D03795F